MSSYRQNWRTKIAKVLNRFLVPLGFVSFADPIVSWHGVPNGWVPRLDGWRFRIRPLKETSNG